MGDAAERGIDPAQKARIIEMCKDGLSRDAIAKVEGCKVARVSAVLHRAGMYTRKTTKRRVVLTDTPAPAEPVVVDALLATGGRYAELAAYAAEQGISEAKALQRWHRARMGLPMLGGV